jgi:hypothetical protein
MPVPEWTRIARVGTPKVSVRPELSPSRISISFSTAPQQPSGWVEYFDARVKLLGIRAGFNSSGIEGNGGYANADEADLETAVAAIDEAIEYANDQYEANVLPALHAEEERIAQEVGEAAKRQAALDKRAAKLAKPGQDPWPDRKA